MSSQCALHCKCPETLVALVGLLMGVDTNVSHQVTGLLELFGAVGALMPADPICLQKTPISLIKEKDYNKKHKNQVSRYWIF